MRIEPDACELLCLDLPRAEEVRSRQPGGRALEAAAERARTGAEATPGRTFGPVGDSASVNAATLRDRPANLPVIGPLPQGLSKPVQILPMNATVSDILNHAAMAAYDAIEDQPEPVAVPVPLVDDYAVNAGLASRVHRLRQRRAIAAGIRRAGAAHLRLRTDSDWLLDIVRFVAAARHARTRGTTR